MEKITPITISPVSACIIFNQRQTAVAIAKDIRKLGSEGVGVGDTDTDECIRCAFQVRMEKSFLNSTYKKRHLDAALKTFYDALHW